MKRRNFLKFASTAAAAKVVPVGLGLSALAQQAQAESPDYAAVNVEVPDVMPQVINIFMYGGASELAGNLSNIKDIELNSQNSYEAKFGPGITKTEAEDAAGFQVTANHFWKDAGGAYMEEMLAAGQMTVYRTIFKKKNPTRSHRDSIFMSHKGTLGIENAPGIGSRLALMMLQNRSAYEGARLADGNTIGDLDEMTLPFVSFEGDSQTYAVDPLNPVPLNMRGLTMSSSFSNPYERGSQGTSESMIEALLNTRAVEIDAEKERYSGAWSGFEKRSELDTDMKALKLKLAEPLPGGVVYENNTFANQLRAAVTLAIHNPQTLYMAVGTPGLGGWDDHNNGVDRYRNRMEQLMGAIKSAMAHIEASSTAATINGARTRSDNIVINVFGDFGRLVNLNGSDGWDHANNQNLYTFGGAGVRPANEADKLGSVIGTTERAGTPGTNNQYTVPTSDSLTWEPMSIAASIYEYFGAANPEVMTASSEDPAGDGSLASKLPAV